MVMPNQDEPKTIMTYPMVVQKYKEKLCSRCDHTGTTYRFRNRVREEVGHWICRDCLRKAIVVLIAECDVFPGKEVQNDE